MRTIPKLSLYLQCLSLINYTRECRTKACIDIAGIFYVRMNCSTKDIGIRVPPCMCLMAIQHFRVECDKQRDRHGYFFYYYDKLSLEFQRCTA